jgi:hypothetical protein
MLGTVSSFETSVHFSSHRASVANIVPKPLILLTLMLEAIHSFEMSVLLSSQRASNAGYY